MLMLKAFLPGAEFLRASRLAAKFEPVLPYLADVAPKTVRETLKQSGVSLPVLPEPEPKAKAKAEKQDRKKDETKNDKKKDGARKSP